MKPASHRTRLFYPAASCGGKAVLLRQLRGPHLSTYRCWMQPVEHGAYGAGVGQQFAQVFHWSIRGQHRTGPLVAPRSGIIDRYPARCISAPWMVNSHSGYELIEKDYKDVSAICETYGMGLPAEYSRFTSQP
jgi:hypothetical protein